MPKLTRLPVATTVSILTILAATHAIAGGFAIKERSAKGQGLSFAGVTAGSGGLSSMGFNPAAIGLVEDGFGNGELSGGISLIIPSTEGQPSVGAVPVGASVDAARTAGLASGYAGYRIDDSVLIGFSLYTPFGLTTKYDAGWLGQFDALTSQLRTFVFSPTLAIEPMTGLTIGASLDILYADVRLTTAAGQLDGDQTDVGFSVGALWEATGTTTLGIAYQHGYNLDIGGTFTPTGGAPLPITARAELPATVSIGVVQEITPDIRVMAEAQWQNWSAFDRIDVTLDITGGLLQSDIQNYDDALFFALGGEYDVNDQVTVRAGAAWDQSPTNTGSPAGLFPPAVNPGATNRTARVPDNDRIWLSIGASYDLNEHMSFDLGYSFLFMPDNPTVGLRNAPAGAQIEYDGTAHIISVGGSIKF